MIIEKDEIAQFQYITPTLGNFKSLELVHSIHEKLKESAEMLVKNQNTEIDIRFTDEELAILKNSISILDQAGQLSINSLSLIKKIRGI